MLFLIVFELPSSPILLNVSMQHAGVEMKIEYVGVEMRIYYDADVIALTIGYSFIDHRSFIVKLVIYNLSQS